MMTSLHKEAELKWEILVRKRASATQGVPPGKEELNWVANTVTLISGKQDALLVDTFLSDEHNAELADWIASKGKTLRKIYLTHAHPDHFFGLAKLLERFPEARAIAMPNVVEAMRVTASPQQLDLVWRPRFPGLLPEHVTIAESMTETSFQLEGQEIRAIDMGHTDTDNTTALYIPSLRMLVAGDVVYNETHAFLVETNRDGRRAWLEALDRAASLEPLTVIVGHGPIDPDNDPAHILATQRYIEDFHRLDRETATAEELYFKMLELYPNRVNPGSLWGSARAAKM